MWQSNLSCGTSVKNQIFHSIAHSFGGYSANHIQLSHSITVQLSVSHSKSRIISFVHRINRFELVCFHYIFSTMYWHSWLCYIRDVFLFLIFICWFIFITNTHTWNENEVDFLSVLRFSIQKCFIAFHKLLTNEIHALRNLYNQLIFCIHYENNDNIFKKKSK